MNKTMILPGEVRFGTSSWAYVGWEGLVYRKPYPKSRFSQDCLAEYAAYEYQGASLFRTVGIDHTFYHPPTVSQLVHYAGQVPEGFTFCSKAWEEITVPIYARHVRYGNKAGTENPRFLDAALCEEFVLAPIRQGLGNHTGPVIFEFQRGGLDPRVFFEKLDRFFSHLPAGYPYAVEIRNPVLLGTRYRDLLKAHGVAHVYNHWTGMPPLAGQHAALERELTAGFAVIRLMTPLGLSHADAVRRYAPYDRLAAPIPRMRADTLTLIDQAVAERKSVYVLVNNRAEGNAPLTIQALADELGQVKSSAQAAGIDSLPRRQLP
jgi:uncharacterized protein YecE (DUF72 family)